MSADDPGCVHEVGRSATGVAWSNPDGTITARTYNAPVNFQTASGSWQPIDTRLTADDSGGVVNRAGPFSAHFAPTASASELVRLGQGATALSFALEGQQQQSSDALTPSPTSTGVVAGAGSSTFSYASALSDVDVSYQVLGEGVKESIVLNQALATGVLPTFRFSVALNGLTAQAADDGTIQFVDSASGKVAWEIPAGLAMDASGASTPVSINLVPSSDPSIAELLVSIDSSWVSDPARVFPVTIDPTVTLPVTYLGDEYIANSTADKNTSFWNIYSYDSTIGDFVDNAGVKSGETYKSLESLDLTGLSGMYIVSANWYGFADALSGTTPVTLTLHPITSSWTPGVATWNAQPTQNTSESATLSYTAGGTWKHANITSWVQNWANGTANDGIEIQGPSSGRVQLAASDSGFNTSYLDVTYDAYPTLSNYSGGGQYQTALVHTTTPTLSATINDTDNPDPTPSTASPGLQGDFEIFTSYTCSGSPMVTSGGYVPATGVSSGQNVTWTVPSGWLSGGTSGGNTYYWHVKGYDQTASTSFSACQSLTVDTTAPSTPTVSIGSMSINTWNTAGGSATASFSATDASNIYGFEWGIDVGDNPTTLATATSNAGSASIAPTWGWHDLAVRAIDNAGNVSAVSHFTFGWGDGGFVTPHNDDTTQQDVTAQVTASTTYTGLRLEYRRSDSDTWAYVPIGDVSYAPPLSGGVTAWPITVTPGTYSSAFPTLIWNAASTLGGVDGPVQLRAAFYDGSTWTYLTDTASIPHLTLNQAQFGGDFATTAAGPGNANLETGNLQLSATDVSLPAGSVTRTFQSRDQHATGGVFGPGWVSNVTASNYASLQDNSDTVVITESDGTELDFGLLTSSSYPHTYQSPDGATDLTLVKDSANHFTLTDLTPTTYGFTNPTGTGSAYVPSDLTNGAGQTTSTTWDPATGKPTAEYGTTPAGLFSSGYSCAYPPSGTNPLTTKGCRTITFDFASTTQTTSLCVSPLGDYAGQLRSVSYTAWDPAGAAMSTVVVADYCYDSGGMLPHDLGSARKSGAQDHLYLQQRRTGRDADTAGSERLELHLRAAHRRTRRHRSSAHRLPRRGFAVLERRDDDVRLRDSA